MTSATSRGTKTAKSGGAASPGHSRPAGRQRPSTGAAPAAAPRAGGEIQLGFRPLYRQVEDVLRQRIGSGVWKSGDMLPSEFELAADLGASQGTVRKALNRMEADNLVFRIQGRGTFVARHDDARILFQFFKLVPDEEKPRFPDSRVLDVTVVPADEEIAEALDLAPRTRVIVLDRIRTIGKEVCIVERIALPHSRFKGLERDEIPNNLYERYRSKFGVTIARAVERLKAVAASRHAARHLSVKVGEPLLLIQRIAYDIEGAPTEWRASSCTTKSIHYLSNLR
ncbi:MAG TPA: GntR family transcriptional regulator [Pseudolabrys sp.]|nr:GntR family transcriptional regulator [Pseudolabrys sp.]